MTNKPYIWNMTDEEMDDIMVDYLSNCSTPRAVETYLHGEHSSHKATSATKVHHALYNTRINDRTIVRIVDDSTGELITRGTWYQDNILSWYDAPVTKDSFDYEENEYTIYISIIEI